MKKLTRRRILQATVSGIAANALQIPVSFAADPLNLGFQMTTWGAVGMVAENLDLFKKFGASVNVHHFDSGVAVRDAMVADRLDIGVSSVSSFIVGVDKGQLGALCVVAYSGASNSIMVATNSNIKSVADLKGRKVASQLGAGSDYTFQSKILPKFGLKGSDLQLVNVKYADQIAALASGSVEAFVGTEPYPSVAEYNKIARTLITFEKYDMIPVMLSVSLPVLKQRSDDLVAFMRGWLASVDIFKKDPARASNIVWKVFEGQGYKLPEGVIRSAIDKLGVAFEYRPELEGYLTAQAEELLRERKIRKLPDWKTVLDHGVLDRARKA